jgi:hypothetical protein
MDSSGYFFNFMPRLTNLIKKNAAPAWSQTITNPQDFPWEVDSRFYASPEKVEYGFGEYE